MRPLVYILIFQFSLGSFLPKTDFSQLYYIPDLIEHYNLHVTEAKANANDFDIFDFIYLHYISPDEHVHQEPFDHSDLPLKTISSCTLICCTNIQFAKSRLDEISFRKSWFHLAHKGSKNKAQDFDPPNA